METYRTLPSGVELHVSIFERATEIRRHILHHSGGSAIPPPAIGIPRSDTIQHSLNLFVMVHLLYHMFIMYESVRIIMGLELA